MTRLIAAIERAKYWLDRFGWWMLDPGPACSVRGCPHTAIGSVRRRSRGSLRWCRTHLSDFLDGFTAGAWAPEVREALVDAGRGGEVAAYEYRHAEAEGLG